MNVRYSAGTAAARRSTSEAVRNLIVVLAGRGTRMSAHALLSTSPYSNAESKIWDSKEMDCRIWELPSPRSASQTVHRRT